MRQRHKPVCLLLTLCLLLSGCWDRREIEERSNVLATGVDLCEEGQKCKVIVTRQIAIPGRIPLGGGSPGANKGESVVAFSTPGKDAIDTARKAQAELNRTVNFGHTRVLIFSESFARQGLESYLDYVRRVPEVRRLMWVLIAEGKAADVVRSRPSLELVPALYLNDMIDDAVKAGRLPDVYFGEFLARISNRGEETIAPVIRMIGLDHPVIAGLAIFRENRMVAKLAPEEMFAYMQLRGLRKGAETFDIPLPEGKKAAVKVYRRNAKYRLREQQGRLQCRIVVDLESELVYLDPELSSDDHKTLETIEKNGADVVVKRSNALLAKLQHEYKSDILAVGELVRAYKPTYWKSVHTDWPKAFSQVEFQVEARLNVRRTGLGKD